MLLPRDIGTYRIIRRAELTAEQLEVLRQAGQERVVNRLIALMGHGAIAASGAQRFYSAYRAAVTTAEGMAN